MTRSRWLARIVVAVLGFAMAACSTQAGSGPSGSTPITRLADGRYAMTVRVNDQGPFTFLVDTGASHPAITQALRDRLHIEANPFVHAKVVGTSGTEPGMIVYLERYRSDVFDRKNEMTLVLPSAQSVPTDGVLGMNAFRSRRLAMDLAGGRLTIGASGAAPAGFEVVRGEVQSGEKLIVDVVVDGVAAKALIDTGARRTTANRALQRALGLEPGDPRLSPADSTGGATTHRLPAEKATIGRLTVGKVGFDAPVVTFADLPVTETLDHARVPAMTLGMDLLGKMKGVAIDFPRAEVQLRP
jgi:predicted aspartyl protease